MEHKIFSAYTVGVDEPEGIVEKIVAVMGVTDLGKDIIHPGAFRKTIQERGLKIKGLDQHDSRSVRNVVAKTLAMRELGRDELPPDLMMQHPDATGALWVQAKYMLGTQPGREVFHLIQEGAISESSIGYDPIVSDFSTLETSEGKETVRNLRELKLYEWSDVVWAMNDATRNISAKEDAEGGEQKGDPAQQTTTTLSAKEDAEPLESKPYNVFEQDSEYCVYKLDADGEPTGETLGCHESVDEAEAQMAALYANEPEADAEKLIAPSPALTPVEQVTACVCPECAAMSPNLDGAACSSLECSECGAAMEGKADMDKADEGPDEVVHSYDVIVDGVHYVQERYVGAETEEKVGRVLAARNARRLQTALDTLTEILKDAGLIQDEEEESEEKGDKPAEDHDAPVAEQAADDTPAEPEAGPDVPPTSERMALLRKLQLELLEVDKQ